MIKTTLGIDGMMCSMCEVHVNDAIRRVFTVKSAKSNRKKGQCVVVSEQSLDRNRVIAALGEFGYELISMTEEPYERRLMRLM